MLTQKVVDAIAVVPGEGIVESAVVNVNGGVFYPPVTRNFKRNGRNYSTLKDGRVWKKEVHCMINLLAYHFANY